MVNLSAYFEKMVVALPQNSKIEVTSFEEGFSNQVYCLAWDDVPQLVLRVPALDEVAFNICRASELQVLSMASQQGLSPALIWQDEAGAFACRYVHQPSFDWDVHHTSKNIVRIAQALSAAHTLPVIGHEFCVYKVIAHYLNRIKSFTVKHPELVSEWCYLSDLLDSLEKVPMTQTPVVCHNDLNPKNLLMDDETSWLIDWEYAGMGDPLFDLAVVARSHNLTQEQRIELVTAYQASWVTSDAMWCIEQYCLAYSLREMTWLLLKHLTTPDDPKALGFYYEFKASASLNPFLPESSIV